MKKTILYAVCAVAVIAAAAFVVVGCDGDMGERSDNMDAFLDWFSGRPDAGVIKYKITFNANGAKGTPPAAITVLKGDSTLLPGIDGQLSKEGYKFMGWSADSLGNVDNVGGGGAKYYPTSNVTLYARWGLIEKVTSTVTVSSAGAGYSGGGSYVDGATVTIKAGTAPVDKQFDKWTSNPAVTFASPTSPITTFTMPTRDVTVTANFVAATEGKYAVDVSSVGVSASGGGSYEAGKTVTINAGTDPFAHRFNKWTTESNSVVFANANSRTTTFIMPANAVTVTANFDEVPTYEVKVVSEGAGASSDSSYKEGDKVTIDAGTAPDKQRFKNWTSTGTGVSFTNANSATTTFTMPANAVTVKANFEPNTFTVTVSAGAGATGGGDYYPGATVTVKAGSSPDGVPFRKWTSSNNNVVFAAADSMTTTFIMPSAEVTITAFFRNAFTDVRDGQRYGVVTIGGKTWMAENLNYQTPDSSRCDYDCKYGRMYAWNAARTACPAGYHLPSRREWGDLAIAAGGTGDYGSGGETAGIRLKATTDWCSYGSNFAKGTDYLGFTALPGGYLTVPSCMGGGWWTDTPEGGYAYYRSMGYTSDNVSESYTSKSNVLSVRCVADD